MNPRSSRPYSLAYLTSHRCSAAEAIRVAAEAGYQYAGLRPWPNGNGAPRQALVEDLQALRETQAAVRDTGVRVFDLEILRIGANFDALAWDRLFEVGAALQARAVLIAADDPDASRLADSYARLCEAMQPFGLTADLEFMPWTEVRDAQAALRVIEQAGRPANAGVLVDAIHFGRSRTTLDDIRRIPHKWLHYAQAGDAIAGTHFTHEQLIHTARCERLMPGEGTIDLSGLFAALPPDLPISVEIVHLEREQNTPPLEWARRCLHASRSIIGN